MKQKSKTITKILIANRGEIAVRIIRTIGAMGLKSVAVYSEADGEGLHTRLADEAILIGPAPAPQSYLSIEKIIGAARESGADAIHPGYGFLSENAEFARACEKECIVFIGPTIEAMEVMGNKARAKMQVGECGVPCIEGYEGRDQSNDAFMAAAKKIGFPIMIKAAAGGGGRGMRLVEDENVFISALETARGEALAGFGSEELILEKAVINAKHIEIQIFGDRHGNLVHLGERDCSMQRRHQKVIEESPSPAVNESLRQRMCEAALKAAQSVSYSGAGTVEFLLDHDENFYFLEMNTRLQVEHPVSEMVSGIDLVEWQIRVAGGEELPLKQDGIQCSGHAVEVRIYAENPNRDFQPSSGKISTWICDEDEAVRVDAGIQSGSEISAHYDPMLAKLIAFGKDRQEALGILEDALAGIVLHGPDNNIDFLQKIVTSETFAKGEYTTSFIAKGLENGQLLSSPPKREEVCLCAVADFYHRRRQHWDESNFTKYDLLNWSSSPLPPRKLNYGWNDLVYDVAVTAGQDDCYTVQYDGENLLVRYDDIDDVVIDGRDYGMVTFIRDEGVLYLSSEKRTMRFIDLDKSGISSAGSADGSMVAAPMHGILAECKVETGSKIEKGSLLAVLEAMKMRHEILATGPGVVTHIHCEPGTQVGAGDVLFEIEEESPNNAAS